MAFYASLAMVGNDDHIAHLFHLSIEPVVWAARVLNWVLPVAAYGVTYHVCRALTRREQETRDEPRGSGSFVKLPSGDYGEVAAQRGR